MRSNDRYAYVVIETTGGRPRHDRIFEIGIIVVEHNSIIDSWETLINPEIQIPTAVTKRTGITDEIVSNAPIFKEVADEIHAKLENCLVISLHSRYTYTFIKNEFEREYHRFYSPSACITRLSRMLYSQQRHHDFETLLKVHQLDSTYELSTLDKARLLPSIIQSMTNEHSLPTVNHAINAQIHGIKLPEDFNEDGLRHLPHSPGIYTFYNENNEALYIGRSINVYERVLAHFSVDQYNEREKQIYQHLHRVESQATAGELGCILTQYHLIQTNRPTLNQQKFSKDSSIYSLFWDEQIEAPKLVHIDETTEKQFSNLYGINQSQEKLLQLLKDTATHHRLCLKILGFEKGPGSCHAYRNGRCQGVCIGEEDITDHNKRITVAMQSQRLKPWPYSGAIAIYEKDPISKLLEIHVIDQWRHLGTCQHEEELEQLASKDASPLDIHLYQILSDYLENHEPEIREISGSS